MHYVVTLQDAEVWDFVTYECLSDCLQLSSLYGLSAALESAALRSANDCTAAIVPTFILLWQYSCRGDLSQHLSLPDHFVSGSKWLGNLLDIMCKCAGNLVQAMTNSEILQVNLAMTYKTAFEVLHSLHCILM